MKPILFNTDMVCALLANLKTATRRPVKRKYSNTHLEMFTNKYGTRLIEKQNEEPGVTIIKNPDGTTTHKLLACIERTPPYRPDDILYVQETFRVDYLANIPGTGRVQYKADGTYADFSFSPDRYDMMRRAQLKPGWRPSENMPREAARIFLRVTDMRVERLQEMTDEDIVRDFNLSEDALRVLGRGCIARKVWNSTVKPVDRALYGWDVNLLVLVISFERISKKEVENAN